MQQTKNNDLGGLPPVQDLPYVGDPAVLAAELRRLYSDRQSVKKSEQRIPRSKLSHAERIVVLEKTDFRCHICGGQVTENDFHADHVSSHSKGGSNDIENHLASCGFCNSYRWDYLPDEIRWILKIGVWAKTQIEFESELGERIADSFVEYEKRREFRRKEPREGLRLNISDYPIREKQDFSKLQKREKKK